MKCALMKIVRVPWIRCRADEVGTCSVDLEWRKQFFKVIAYSEREAQEWWGGLRDAERSEVLGIEQSGVEGDQASFW
jgi:hypothetical protein